MKNKKKTKFQKEVYDELYEKFLLETMLEYEKDKQIEQKVQYFEPELLIDNFPKGEE